jgi:hypothetical protein
MARKTCLTQAAPATHHMFLIEAFWVEAGGNSMRYFVAGLA